MMEERWGELEAEHSAAAQAVSLAESWGMVRTQSSFLISSGLVYGHLTDLCPFHNGSMPIACAAC